MAMVACFNGAALVRVRKWVSVSRHRPQCTFSFNGAALVRVRKSASNR